ncbi:MAG: SDR family oxidoreductase [Candidatus Methylomirabilales bacterium]
MSWYLVTGGAGFIGSHLVEALLHQGEAVRVLDNFTTGRRENLAPILDRIELLEGDLRDRPMVEKAVEEIEVIFHQGALPSVSRSIEDPMTSHEVNATGTLNLLVAARAARVRRLVYASSSSIYGESPVLPKEEEMPPRPLSPYAVSKLVGEYYCQVFYAVYGLETVCLRYFNVFGPCQDPASPYAAVIPRFIHALLQGKAPVIFGDGHQTRDFTFVANVVNATLLAAHAPGADGQVMNVACGQRFSLLDLVAALRRTLEVDLPPRFAPPRPGDIRHSQASIAKAQKLLGYQPRVSFEEGLHQTVQWMRSQMGRKR